MKLINLTGIKIFNSSTELAIIVNLRLFNLNLYKRNKIKMAEYTRLGIPNNHKYLRIQIEIGPLDIFINLMKVIDKLDDYIFESVIDKELLIIDKKELNDHKYNNGERIEIDKEKLKEKFEKIIENARKEQVNY